MDDEMMDDDYIELCIGDDGVAHQVVSTQLYFESEEELDKFNEAIKSNRLVLVTRCKNCRYMQGCKNAQHLGLEGYCSKGEDFE